MANADLYVVIPEWAMWLMVVGLFFSLLSNLAEIYIHFLKRKLDEKKDNQ